LRTPFQWRYNTTTMFDTPAPVQTLAAQFPGNDYYYLVHTLCQGLPDPLTDSPEDLARRNDAAIAEVAALCPANLVEAKVAVLHVAASEHALRALREAVQPDISLLGAMKCRAQANSMMRQSQGALRLLLRMQAARQKTEANAEARDRAAWAEHCALNLMTEALSPPKAPSLSGSRLGEAATPAEEKTAPTADPADHRAHFHLSRAAGEVAAPRAAGEGAAARLDLPAPSPQRTAMIRLLKQFNDPKATRCARSVPPHVTAPTLPP
jgi:hypothetical protein